LRINRHSNGIGAGGLNQSRCRPEEIDKILKNKTYCHYCGNRLTKKPWEGPDPPVTAHACDLPVYENPIPAACHGDH
jgi:hypothetical protein